MCALLLFGLLVLGAPPEYRPLDMHELIGFADLAVSGTIEEVGGGAVTVRVEQVGFGSASVGDRLLVARFNDWTCAKRFAPYEVGQRCAYFLFASGKPGDVVWKILGGGGEGEMRLDDHGGVRMRADLGGTLGHRPEVAALLAECARYRAVFRMVPAAGGHWCEPLGSNEDVERYRGSSRTAAFLVQQTMDDRYRDAGALSPRPAEAVPRIDLGIGRLPTAITAVPDLDGDGLGELVCAQGGRLWLVCPDAEAKPKRKRLLLSPAEEVRCSALACIGDLDGDGVSELAVGDPLANDRAGGVRVLSCDMDGESRWWERALSSDSGGFGAALAPLGDLTGDGTLELAVSSCWGWTAPAVLSILSLERDGRLRSRSVLPDDERRTSRLALSRLGDLDGNGVEDLAVGTPGTAAGSVSGGVEILLLGPANDLLRTIVIRTEARRGDDFGVSIAGVGDWNDDGVPDLAVGTRENLAFVLFLARDGSVTGEKEIRRPGPMDDARRVQFGGQLAPVSRGTAAFAVVGAGYSWVDQVPDARGRVGFLRAYPSLWMFEPSTGPR